VECGVNDELKYLAYARHSPLLMQCGKGPLQAYFWDDAGVAWPIAEPKNCNVPQATAARSWLTSKAVQRPPVSVIDSSNSTAQDNLTDANPASSRQNIWGSQPLWTPAAVVAPPPATSTTTSVTVQTAPTATTVAAVDTTTTPQPNTPATATTTPSTPSNDGYAEVARRASPAWSVTKVCFTRRLKDDIC